MDALRSFAKQRVPLWDDVDVEASLRDEVVDVFDQVHQIASERIGREFFEMALPILDQDLASLILDWLKSPDLNSLSDLLDFKSTVRDYFDLATTPTMTGLSDDVFVDFDGLRVGVSIDSTDMDFGVNFSADSVAANFRCLSSLFTGCDAMNFCASGIQPPFPNAFWGTMKLSPILRAESC